MSNIPNTIRIAIADDHPMVISGLHNMLATHSLIRIEGSYSDSSSLLEGLEASLPHVLLLDIQMPDISGAELVRIVLKRYPELPILMLTNLDSVLYVHNMLKHGAKGYLLKTATEDTLVTAIKCVHEGGQFLEPEIQERLNEFTAKMRREATLTATLTKREKEILRMIVNGETSKEISEKLHLGYRTVESYRFNILMKLDAKNTAVLVKKALEMGLV
jgi:DNA-binding NarL/FixJ family response regulator